MYAYSAAQWMLLFYFYCVVGWCFESTVVSFGERRFVNRGFLHGPMLPLYGTGAILLILVSIPLRGRSPVVLFLAGMIAATALEYVTGVVMEAIFGVKYWDYSTHRFQFQGRICLQSSLAWADAYCNGMDPSLCRAFCAADPAQRCVDTGDLRIHCICDRRDPVGTYGARPHKHSARNDAVARAGRQTAKRAFRPCRGNPQAAGGGDTRNPKEARGCRV